MHSDSVSSLISPLEKMEQDWPEIRVVQNFPSEAGKLLEQESSAPPLVGSGPAVSVLRTSD